MSFADLLARGGRVMGASQDRSYELQQREQEQKNQQLNHAMMMQRMMQSAQAFDQQQQELMRDRQSATVLSQILGGGAPGGMDTSMIPGDRPMPKFNQNNGAAITGGTPAMRDAYSQQIGGGQQPPMQQRPPMQPQGPTRPGMQQPGGMRAGGQQPAQMGGIPVFQLSQMIDEKYPGIDPLTKLSVIQQYQNLLKPEDQKMLRELQLQISQGRADTANQVADLKLAAASGPDKVFERELKMKAQTLGIDTKGKSVDDLSASVAEAERKGIAQKDAKTSAGERRALDARKQTNTLSNQALELIKKYPESVGIWSKGSVAAAKAAGIFGADAPENAKAATQLQVLLAQIAHHAGVSDSAGTQGGTKFATEYEKILGSRDMFSTAELLASALQAVQGDLSQSLGTADGDIPAGIDAEDWKYMQPEQRALFQKK